MRVQEGELKAGCEDADSSWGVACADIEVDCRDASGYFVGG